MMILRIVLHKYVAKHQAYPYDTNPFHLEQQKRREVAKKPTIIDKKNPLSTGAYAK
jgi:hypothetical protein